MKRMNLAWLVVLMIASLLGSGCQEESKNQQVQETEAAPPQQRVAPPQSTANQAPDFSGTTLDGKTIKLSDYRGKVVVIDFWATWCPPCRKAIPQISALAKEYEGKDVVILGASSEELKKVENFWSKYQPGYAAIIVDQAVFGSYGVRGIPTMCIVDRKGAIRYQESGFSPKMKVKLAQVIDRLLED